MKFFTTQSLRINWINGDVRISQQIGDVLYILVIGALPSWPYCSGWGYYPSSGLGLVLMIVLLFVLLGGRT